MTRILVLGDLAGTGFGTVTLDLGTALLARGEDVRVLSMNAVGTLDEPHATTFAGRVLNLLGTDGWLRMPESADDARENERRLRGLFTGEASADAWAPEAVLIIGDMGSLKVSPFLDFLPPGLRVLHYVPIEGVDLPPRWAEPWRRLQPVAMSQFGAGEIEKITGTRPPVVYHGVNTADFWPVSELHPITIRHPRGLQILRSRTECRTFLGWNPAEIILFRADRHMPRKMYPSLLRAIAPVLTADQGTRLVWHCRTVDEGGDLRDERSKYAPAIAERMNSTGIHDQFGGAPRSILNVLYNAADIYVSNSAEGFGLTIAEAMACGIPAVGMDYSAVPEVIGPGGIVVPPAGLVDNIYSHYWARVDEPAFAAAVLSLVRSRRRRKELGFLAANHVARTFTWAGAAEQMAALAAGVKLEAVAA